MDTKLCFVCKQQKADEDFYVADWICKPCRKTWNKERYTRRRVELMLAEEPFATLISRMEELSTENSALKAKLKKYRKESVDTHEEQIEHIAREVSKEVAKKVVRKELDKRFPESGDEE